MASGRSKVGPRFATSNWAIRCCNGCVEGAPLLQELYSSSGFPGMFLRQLSNPKLGHRTSGARHGGSAGRGGAGRGGALRGGGGAVRCAQGMTSRLRPPKFRR